MSKTGVSSNQRMYYVDNIRIYLTILVIIHHLSIAYGGSGDWFLKEPPTDSISPIIFLLFTALNQSYFMSFFFILAGYFTPRSLEKKGPANFLIGRLTRLGIPMIFYALFLGPLMSWMVANFAGNLGVSFYSIWHDVFTFTSLQNISFGHLWFLEVLLVFALGYVAYSALFGDRSKPRYENSFPSNKTIIICIGILAASDFLVRIMFPINTWVFGVQPAHMVGYLFGFVVGVNAYNGKWFDSLSNHQAMLWGKIALINTLALPVMIILVVASGGSIDAFLGGVTWQSLVNSVWESISYISIVIWLLHFFKTRFNKQNNMLDWMAPNVFAAYIFHPLVIVAVMIPLLNISLPSVVKFFIVSFISVPLSFLVSYLIKQIPYANRIL
ncbi:MAG: acyltransferase family protein [Candidatus Bathyarchaeota archaeon]|nr:acyltransferase family protein [Candidatus Bathyarchaeota archaeon]